jgi:hypothetical protein
VLAHWHGLAKLRMHTNLTLDILDEATISLGKQSRFFADKICPKFDTRELAREADARKRRASKSGTATASITTRKAKTFNLRTYKYHSLGDYGDTIRRHGTCDSYSTEPVSVGSRLSQRTEVGITA